MRLFSVKEKQIIQQLLDQSSRTNTYLPINVFNDIFNGLDVGFYGSGPMEFIFPYDANGIPSADRMISIYNEILERALLIDYLEKDGLIYIVPSSTSVNRMTTIGNVSRLNRVAMSIDNSIGEILLRCMNSPIYISETLKDYVRSGFMSLEEQALSETKKQTKYSYWAVVLAVLAIIISLIQTCSGSFSNNKDASDTTNIIVPLNGILYYMQNNLDGKLEGIMNNTIEIQKIMGDSITISNPCNCRRQNTSNSNNMNTCVKYVRVNVCQDTIVAKSTINDSIR